MIWLINHLRGYPYNVVGAVKNIDMKVPIMETLEEMDQMNKNLKLMYIVYCAFTKKDLMSKTKSKMTRIISGSSAHINLSTQRFSKVFEEKATNNHRRNGMKIGIGKFYQEFDSVRKYLEAIGEDLCFFLKKIYRDGTIEFSLFS